MDGRDEENQRGHRCGCRTAWGGLIPRQGALIAYSLPNGVVQPLAQMTSARERGFLGSPSAIEHRAPEPLVGLRCSSVAFWCCVVASSKTSLLSSAVGAATCPNGQPEA